MLGEDRQEKIKARIMPLLRMIDPDLHLLKVILDSTRQQLAFVLQKGEQPIVIGMNWLDYVSHRDDELRNQISQSVALRLEASARRKSLEEEE
jgi:hypothetical protein